MANALIDWFNSINSSVIEASELKGLASTPLISLLVPVYNTKEVWLRECIESVINQIYPYWELCICNNGSTEPHVQQILNGLIGEWRVKIKTIQNNQNGAEGTNAAFTKSTAHYVALMDSDDVLMPDALLRIAQAINQYPQAQILYTDEIITNPEGVPELPFFKPDFNENLLHLLHYFGHLSVYTHNVFQQLGMRFSGGSYDYDLALRASEIVAPGDIIHIPHMVYKYRIYEESTSHRTAGSCVEGGLAALQEHLDRTGHGATARNSLEGYRVSTSAGVDLRINSIGLVKPYEGFPTGIPHMLQRLENYP